jgi:hypothetical protein
VAFHRVMRRRPGASRAQAFLAVLAMSGMACGGDAPGEPDDGGASADAGQANPYTCEEAPRSGEPFDLRVGLKSDDGFHEIADGDEAPVVLGPQGLYMLQLDVRATLAIPSDSVCMYCVDDVSPWGNFAGITQPGVMALSAAQDGSFLASTIVIVAGGEEMARELDGAEVALTKSCDGHGFSAQSEHQVNLYLAP